MKTYKPVYLIGPAGTNTHEVCVELGLGEPTFCASNIAALNDVAACYDKETLAIVPIENSTTGGLVEDTRKFWMELLNLSARGIRKPVCVIGEHRRRISYCLAGKTQPRSGYKVSSHPQALSQCSAFLGDRGFEQVPAKSTASAAAQAATNPGLLAVCTRFAAELNELTVFEEGIENEPENETRFHLVAGISEAVSKTGEDRTALLFTLEDRPAALAYAQLAFGCEGVNLTVSHSIPLGSPGKYAFYLEADCHQYDPVGLRCFARLRTFTDKLLILGSYPREKGGVR